MKTRLSLSVAGTVLIALLLLQPVYSDDKPSESANADANAKPAAKKKISTRLPNHFGRLGLTAEQQSNARSVQKKYGDQIAELKKKIQELEGKRNSELRALLTTDQQTHLDDLQAEAKAKRAARKAATTSANSEEKQEEENDSAKRGDK